MRFQRALLCTWFCLGTNALLAQAKPTEDSAFRTRHDFDASTVQGERTSPMGTMLDQVSVDQSYDFVTIRRNWRPEMIQSTSSLDTEVQIFLEERRFSRPSKPPSP